MVPTKPVTEAASARFKLDKIYKRKAIVHRCDRFLELSAKHALALVKSKDPRLCDIVFEFDRIRGSKWKCFGVARSSYFDHKLQKEGLTWS